MSKEGDRVQLRYDDDHHSSGGEDLPLDLKHAVGELFNTIVARIAGRPIEMNINGDWEHPADQSVVPSDQPATLERRKLDTKTGTYIGLGVITVAAVLTAVHTYRHVQKKKQ